MRSLKGKAERVLIVGVYPSTWKPVSTNTVYNDKYEGWHPTLGEFKLLGGAKPAKYSEVDVTLKIKSFAPLEFESVMPAP